MSGRDCSAYTLACIDFVLEDRHFGYLEFQSLEISVVAVIGRIRRYNFVIDMRQIVGFVPLIFDQNQEEVALDLSEPEVLNFFHESNFYSCCFPGS